MGNLGAKAETLLKLKEVGFNVPALIAMPSNTSISEALKLVENHFDKNVLLAVRSSAANEDGEDKSMAGAYHSEVAVSIDEFTDAWEKVVASMPLDQNAVIVQEMIFGDFSGVCFSDCENRRAMINALPGLCKAVVEGYESDYFELESNDLVFNHSQESKDILIFEEGKLQPAKSKECISKADLQSVYELGMKLSEHLGSIQDIEWTLKNNELFLLQARPVTANPWKGQKIKIYDSANVGESYSGIVLPLTLTFASKLYKQVYEDLLCHSAVSESALKKAEPIFDKLVEPVYGRMYYRMDNWYAFLRMLPGFKRNASNLEDMLMLSSKAGNVNEELRPTLWLKLIYYPLVIWKLFGLNGKIARLKKEAETLFEQAGNWNLSDWSEKQVDEKIDELFNGVLKRWYLTVENDTVMMSLFAHYSKPNSKVPLDDVLSFHSASSDQIVALIELSAKIKQDKKLNEAISNKDEDAFHSALHLESDLGKEYKAYLQFYGGRFANELKLETPGVEDNFGHFAALIEMYWKDENLVQPKQSNAKLPWLARVFQRFGSRREAFRLYRANMFGIIRKLVLRKAECMVGKNKLNHENDIFYLEWSEVFSKNNSNFKSLIDTRKAEYLHYGDIEPPAYFNVVNGRWPIMRSEKHENDSWQGLGASKGRVQANATVMKTFDPQLIEDVGILVTQRTDPGWTPLMALSKGIVVEHGGMLSHASIVARELQIPAVIGIKDACGRIKNGDQVMVDGDTGLVSVKQKESNE
ncbi:PEP-utilizing enzyme [Salibacteraceae bacterium]|nr:PEP-utilizing enzyme [Salibacteraceae bacterium]MDC1222049.1 PEP-utilizing enzyme [Salibacteraceae bacterium]